MVRSQFFWLLCLIAPGTLCAQSFYDTELNQLTERHDKALAAASAPINREYQAALEALLLRATRNKDLEASSKIVTALSNLKALTAAPDAPGSLKGRIEELLTSKMWVHANQWHYKFTKDGKVTQVEQDRKGRYTIDDKTGFVAFVWEQNKFPGEGIQFDKANGTFMHNKGEAMVPVK